MSFSLKDKRVLVTGACGTVGWELVRQLLEEHTVGELISLDNNETELLFLEQTFANHEQAHFFLADIRDRSVLSHKFKGVDIVFHAAAFKHVILCERSPFEAVQTNILGTQNIILSAIENTVQRVVFTSTDKAVNPTNVMGTSKLMCERLMTAANSTMREHGTIFTSTRFGNVLGSRGSVIPIFREQIRQGGPVTLTDPEMTRFIMSIRDAVELVINSVHQACGGEIFVTKMPVIRIVDLAQVMIDELAPRFGFKPADVPIQIVGTKAGEKMYEELLSPEETRRSWELDNYFVVLPAFSCIYHNISYTYPQLRSTSVAQSYQSNNEVPLSRDQLAQFLLKHNLLDEDIRARKNPTERYWPENGAGADVSRVPSTHKE